MKTICWIIRIWLVTIFLQGCAVQYTYQVCDISNVKSKDSTFFMADSIGFQYNFWSQGGSSSIGILNKTNHVLTVDLKNSFYIVDGISYALYTPGTKNFGTSSVSSSGNYTSKYLGTYIQNSTTSAGSLSIFSQEDFRIAPMSAQELDVSGPIASEWFVDCDLQEMDIKKGARKTYDLRTTPKSFSYYLSLKLSNGSTIIYNSSPFYISAISILSYDAFYDAVPDYDECKTQKTGYNRLVPTAISPRRFYIVHQGIY